MKQAYNKYIICCFFFVGFLISSPAQAQTITTIQPLDFGEAVVFDNNAQYELIVTRTGNVSSDPQFSIIEPPTEGIYLLSGAPARQRITTININVDQQMVGTGENFIIDSFDIRHNPQTDNSGELMVEVGARLLTTGSGIPYTAATSFNAVMTMDIIY